MEATRLRNVTLAFPTDQAEQRIAIAALADLLAQAPGATRVLGGVLMVPLQPPVSLPTTTVRGVEGGTLQVLLETNQPIDLTVGPVQIRSSVAQDRRVKPPNAPNHASPGISAVELVRRLDGHITRVDHTGVNLPTRQLHSSAWARLCSRLGEIANLYRYPTGEEWPFVVPATEHEFRTDITEFAPGRCPRFELVHDPEAIEPIVQLALGTDLPRGRVEALFPDPEGIDLPGVGGHFRSVHLSSPWAGLLIRIDLYHAGDGQISDWETGAWVVNAGGRIR